MKNENLFKILMIFYGFSLAFVSLALIHESYKQGGLTVSRLFVLLVMLTIGITMIRIELIRK